MPLPYMMPEYWIKYDPHAIVAELTDAKAAVISLKSIPYQRSWTDALQQVQLKSEVAGTSQIEGADFTGTELDDALAVETPEQLHTRSQRQAHCAVQTYRWIARLPDDRPIDESLILQVHRGIVTGCDDDHCPPGILRAQDQNVVFGSPRHRGATGGAECAEAFSKLSASLANEFRQHDPLIQSLALHYHIGAMHPFLDGNGRTARAVEALLLQRAGLRDELFIAMSNFYYDEKPSYLAMLSKVRENNYDLTPFLSFGLRGIASQCHKLLRTIRNNVQKTLFRDVAYDLFNRMRTPKQRYIAKRQMAILNMLLESDKLLLDEAYKSASNHYSTLKNPWKAYIRDMIKLVAIGAVQVDAEEGSPVTLKVNLDWPTEITETDFFERASHMPQAKTYKFMQVPSPSTVAEF